MKALAGIRVVDFSWVRAGPWATRWLGAFGPLDPHIQALLDKGTGVPATHTLPIAPATAGSRRAARLRRPRCGFEPAMANDPRGES